MKEEEYTLGLMCGGLMEDPGWHIEDVRTVSASGIREAKQKWAEATGKDDPKWWDKEAQTYWGWKVVEA